MTLKTPRTAILRQKFIFLPISTEFLILDTNFLNSNAESEKRVIVEPYAKLLMNV
jgi:hypothetical protein